MDHDFEITDKALLAELYGMSRLQPGSIRVRVAVIVDIDWGGDQKSVNALTAMASNFKPLRQAILRAVEKYNMLAADRR
jgi:hypothetical protein